jgi:outer membrane protein assembly factor BamB
LYAINADGSVKWSFTADSPIDSSPAIAASGVVYFASDGGTLYAIQ